MLLFLAFFLFQTQGKRVFLIQNTPSTSFRTHAHPHRKMLLFLPRTCVRVRACVYSFISIVIIIVSWSNYPKNLELTSFFVVVVVVVVFRPCRSRLPSASSSSFSVSPYSSFNTTQTSATAVAERLQGGCTTVGRYNVKVDRKVANPVLFIFCSFRFALCYLCSGLLLDFFAPYLPVP